MNPALVTVVVQQLPALIDLIRSIHARANPDAPAPTDAMVIAAFNAACASSLAKDDLWLAQHPIA